MSDIEKKIEELKHYVETLSGIKDHITIEPIHPAKEDSYLYQIVMLEVEEVHHKSEDEISVFLEENPWVNETLDGLFGIIDYINEHESEIVEEDYIEIKTLVRSLRKGE